MYLCAKESGRGMKNKVAFILFHPPYLAMSYAIF